MGSVNYDRLRTMTAASRRLAKDSAWLIENELKKDRPNLEWVQDEALRLVRYVFDTTHGLRTLREAEKRGDAA